jgi:hypothetical protein
MVGPPKYVKAVQVHNTTDDAVQVTVEYENVKGSGEEIKATKSIAAGASETFEEKLADMGSWEVRSSPSRSCRQPGSPGSAGRGELAPASARP